MFQVTRSAHIRLHAHTECGLDSPVADVHGTKRPQEERAVAQQRGGKRCDDAGAGPPAHTVISPGCNFALLKLQEEALQSSRQVAEACTHSSALVKGTHSLRSSTVPLSRASLCLTYFVVGDRCVPLRLRAKPDRCVQGLVLLLPGVTTVFGKRRGFAGRQRAQEQRKRKCNQALSGGLQTTFGRHSCSVSSSALRRVNLMKRLSSLLNRS